MPGLPYDEFPYEEGYPPNGELEHQAKVPEALEVHREVLYDFHIFKDLCDRKKGGVSFTKWAKYHIGDLKRPKTLSRVLPTEVEARIVVVKASNAKEKSKREQTYISSHIDGGIDDGTAFKSYHY